MVGKVFEGIDETMARWISAQPVWFVATAPLAPDGHVNVSPRGHDSLSILGPGRVAWVDYTGSGVETIAHVRENGRICLMFASFDRRPRVVRLHVAAPLRCPVRRRTTTWSGGTLHTPAPAPSSSWTWSGSASPAGTAYRSWTLSESATCCG